MPAGGAGRSVAPVFPGDDGFRVAAVTVGVLLGLLGPATEAGAVVVPAELTPGARVWTVAGTGGEESRNGIAPGAPATTVGLGIPNVIAATPDGGFLTVIGCRVFRIGLDGAMQPAAGDGRCRFRGDGGPAMQASLEAPLGNGLAPLPGGGFLVSAGTRVRRVGADGVITTVAGNGKRKFSGDGGPATRAGIGWAGSVALTPDGGFLFLGGAHRVRRVDPAGVITTVAGNGRYGFSGDGRPATTAAFSFDPASGLAVLSDGGFLVADTGNQRIRRVGSDGIVRTVAGGRDSGPPGDGGAATQARFDGPVALLVQPDGSYLVGEYAGRVRSVGLDGIIHTVVGSGRWPLGGLATAIFDGDGLAPRAATASPEWLARATDGSLLIASRETGRIVAVVASGAARPAVAITGTMLTRHRLGVRFASAAPGTVELRATRRGRIAGHARVAQAVAGEGLLDLRRPRHAGVYRLDLILTSAAALPVRSTVGVLVGRLSMRTARRALANYYDASTLSPFNLHKCRPFSARRVDCETVWFFDDGSFGCLDLHAISVRADGLVSFRRYRCPRRGQPLFRRHPRWRHGGGGPPFGRLGIWPAPVLNPDNPRSG